MGIEYSGHYFWNLEQKRDSYFNIITLLDNISYFVLYLICIASGSIVILLKKWIEDESRIGILENEKIRSEVDQLKDQINPQFLSNILVKTSQITKTEPQKASEMLFKLSQLLRYGLYDCNREKVLLSSEISFLDNYLKLNQLYKGNLDYTISATGNMNMVFISPLLFMPLVQNIIENNKNEHLSLDIEIKTNDNNVSFFYKGDSKNFDFSGIRTRLDLLYENNYTLSVSRAGVELELNTSSHAR